MTRRTVRNLTLTMAALVVAGLGIGWWWLAIGRWPLAGDRSHDFGTVLIGESHVGKTHTFQLRNRTNRELEIEGITPGCGCTAVEASTRQLAPGETVDLDVTLTLGRVGRKRTDVKLLIRDFGVQSVFIEGIGVKDADLIVNTKLATLTPGEVTALTMFFDRQTSNEMPDQPVFRAPEGVEVSTVRWEAVREEASLARPSRWRGYFKVSLADGADLEPGAELLVALPPAGSATVRLVKRDVPAPPPESPGAPAPDDR